MKDNLIDFEPKYFALLKNILKLHIPYKTVWVYGSRVKWTAGERSDIDLVVFNVETSKIEDLKDAFAESDLPILVDIMDWDKIPKNFKNNILQKYVVLQEKPNLEEWKIYKLGDAPLEILDGDRGKNYPPQEEFIDSGYCLFLSTKNVRIDGFDFSDCQFISQERDKLLGKGKLQKNDVVLTTRGTIGNLGFYNDSVKFENIRINSGMVIIRPDETRLLPTYNYYIFRKLQNDFHSFVSGSAQPQLPIRDLKEVEVLIPSLPEQQAIASVLSSLDDKIDLLHRQNKTLEAMAETIFRQWFVEEAKEEWEEISLYNAIELVGGGTPKTTVAEYWDGDIKWLSGGDISNNHKSVVISSEKSITEVGLKNSSARLLPRFSTVISARGTVGKYCILSEPMAFSQSNYGIMPKYKDCYFFTYLLINHSVEELQSGAYGSVFDTITTDTFKGQSLRLPKTEVIKEFEKIIEPYFLKIDANQQQISTITILRDTLLPKLMSGEARVEIDKEVSNG